jgi:hypothetical protein
MEEKTRRKRKEIRLHLSLPHMWKDFPGVSAGSEPGAEFGAGQRAGRDVVPVGTQLWSGVAGVRQLGSGALQ